MIREIKNIFLLAKKNFIYRVFLTFLFIIFLYFFYILFHEINSPFSFIERNGNITTDLLYILSQNIAPLCFYSFSIFFISDITTNYFNYINPFLKVRNKKVFDTVLSHFLFISAYSIAITTLMNLIYRSLTNFTISKSQILYSIILIIMLQLIIILFNTIGLDFLGYILDIIFLTYQISLTEKQLYTKIFYYLVLITGIVILNYYVYKRKEII